MTELETLLAVSVELARASPELRRHVKALQIENARMRALMRPITDFDLNADSTPALLRPQI